MRYRNTMALFLVLISCLKREESETQGVRTGTDIAQRIRDAFTPVLELKLQGKLQRLSLSSFQTLEIGYSLAPAPTWYSMYRPVMMTLKEKIKLVERDVAGIPVERDFIRLVGSAALALEDGDQEGYEFQRTVQSVLASAIDTKVQGTNYRLNRGTNSQNVERMDIYHLLWLADPRNDRIDWDITATNGDYIIRMGEP